MVKDESGEGAYGRKLGLVSHLPTVGRHYLPTHLPTCPERTALLAQTKSHCSGAWLLMYVYMCARHVHVRRHGRRRDAVGGGTQAAGALIFCLVCFSAFLHFRVSACCFLRFMCFHIGFFHWRGARGLGSGFLSAISAPTPAPGPNPQVPSSRHLQLCGVCVRQAIGVNWPIISYH